jgi:hypothetical protein
MCRGSRRSGNTQRCQHRNKDKGSFIHSGTIWAVSGLSGPPAKDGFELTNEHVIAISHAYSKKTYSH